jgi:hypothetical protein
LHLLVHAHALCACPVDVAYTEACVSVRSHARVLFAPHARTHARMHARTHAHTHTRTHTHARAHTHTHTLTHAHAHIQFHVLLAAHLLLASDGHDRGNNRAARKHRRAPGPSRNVPSPPIFSHRIPWARICCCRLASLNGPAPWLTWQACELLCCFCLRYASVVRISRDRLKEGMREREIGGKRGVKALRLPEPWRGVRETE